MRTIKLWLTTIAVLLCSITINAEEGIDVTNDYIVNPYFDYVEWNTGWSTTTGAVNNQLNDNKKDGIHITGYYWENWDWNPFTGKMYQTLYVPNGVYELSMAAFATYDAEDSYAYDTYMYANTSMAEVGYLSYYSVKVWVTDNTIEIGLGMPVPSQNWVGMDNVSLTYLGDSFEMYQTALEELAASADQIFLWDRSAPIHSDAIEAVEMAIQDAQWVSYVDEESIKNAYDNLSDAIAMAMTSYHKYALLHSALSELKTALEDCQNESVRDDAQSLHDKVQSAYNRTELSNEEIDILLEEIKKTCLDLKIPDLSDASDENPIDVTGYINNPKYEEYNGDWTGSGWMMNVSFHNVEFYNENFYYFQTLTGLPDGMYKIDVQGYYRPGTTVNSYNLYQKSDKTKLYAKLFAETSEVRHTTYLQSIISEASKTKLRSDDVKLSNGLYVPYTMGGAHSYFQKDLYHNYIYIYVTGGTLTIGLEKDKLIADDWTIFTNWSLTYYGEDSQHVDGDASGKYTITYTVDGKGVYSQDFAPNMKVIPLEEVPEKEGHTFVGWDGIPDIMPENDVTATGIFTTNKYKITYSLEGEIIASDSIEYGKPIITPEAPEKTGYTFDGWGNVPATMPATDLSFEGSYSINYYKLTYVIDDEVYKIDSIAYGETITVIDNPVKEGHTFNGWSESPDVMPANDIIIKGSFTANKYLVTFIVDDVIVSSDSLEYGTAIVAPAIPVLEGYTFSWWPEVDETVPATDVVYTGSYTANVYKIFYFVGTTLVHIAEVAYGEAIPEYVYEPTTEGDVFMGWIGETYETMPAHDVTYMANITNDVLQLTINNGQLTIYDLKGRKVTDTEKLRGGIYIVNGRKVFIK